jgi:site-specific recombinase XerD
MIIVCSPFIHQKEHIMYKLKRISFSIVHNRTKRLNKDGTAAAQFRLTKKGQSKYRCAGVWVEPRHWDARNHCVKSTHPLAKTYNQHLAAELERLKAFEEQALQKYGDCPLAMFELYGKAPDDGRPATFNQFCLQEVERPGIGAGTRRGDLSSVRLFCSFQAPILWDDITLAMVHRYDRFLHRRGLAINTIARHHIVVKKMINRAIALDHLPMDANPYRKFRPKTEEPDRVYLDAEEIRKLEELVLPPQKDHLEKARRVFLLSCYTGLRFGDVTSLARCHLSETPKGLELAMKTEKNGKLLKLPLWLLFNQGRVQWSKPEAIIRKTIDEQSDYIRRAGLLTLPLLRICNQYLNRCLKELAKLAGIDKHLTHHCARRSFATALATKVKTPVLQRLLNHSRIDMTLIYVRLSNAAIEEELQTIDWTDTTDEAKETQNKLLLK